MSRKNVRLLASGFLFSGLLILVLNVIRPAEISAGDPEAVEALETEIRYLEEAVVSLELENEQLIDDNNRLVQENADSEGSDADTEEVEEDTEQENHSETEDTDTDEEQEEEQEESTQDQESEEDVTEYVVVVNEGDPSSVVSTQLEAFGLIDDYHGFNAYMEENNLFRQLRPGEYTVHSDMNREQLIEAIIR